MDADTRATLFGDEADDVPKRGKQLMTEAEASCVDGLEEGDEIEVSERETPMTVASVRDGEFGTVTVIARNHHGRYRFRSHLDGTVSMYASAKLVTGEAKVSIHDR